MREVFEGKEKKQMYIIAYTKLKYLWPEDVLGHISEMKIDASGLGMVVLWMWCWRMLGNRMGYVQSMVFDYTTTYTYTECAEIEVFALQGLRHIAFIRDDFYFNSQYGGVVGEYINK